MSDRTRIWGPNIGRSRWYWVWSQVCTGMYRYKAKQNVSLFLKINCEVLTFYAKLKVLAMGLAHNTQYVEQLLHWYFYSASIYLKRICSATIWAENMSPVKPICVFEHSVMTNFNCACPVIQRGQGSDFLSEGSSWLTACMSEQRRFWRDCAGAQARLTLRCSHRR